MGWRFRKTVRLSSLLRVNFSGSGISLGLGPRGANINISKRGVRRTVGLPGTGISHQTFTSWNSTTSTPSAGLSEPPPQSTGGPSFLRLAIVFGVLALGAWGIVSIDTPRAPAATTGASAPPPPASAVPTETVKPTMPPPAANRPLTADEVKEAQTLLKALGFDPGGADGLVGPMTIAAVKRYEPARGWPASGEVDIRLLESLRASNASPAASPVKQPAPATAAPSPAPTSPPTMNVPNAEMRLAMRVIRQADHPCPAVAAAVTLSDGSLKAVCSNSETYRVFQFKGDWFAMKCSAAQRMGVEGC